MHARQPTNRKLARRWQHVGSTSVRRGSRMEPSRKEESLGYADRGRCAERHQSDAAAARFRDFIKGISVRNNAYGHAAKCDRTTRNTNFFLHVQNATREVKY